MSHRLTPSVRTHACRALMILVPLAGLLACSSTPESTPDAAPSPDQYVLPKVSAAEVPDFLRDRLNAMREAVGHPALFHFEELTATAQSHAAYVAAGTAGTKFHLQIEDTPGFTGVTLQDRAKAADFPEVAMGEWIAFRRDEQLAPTWLDGPYVRALALQPHVRYLGIGTASGDAGGATVMLLGMQAVQAIDNDHVTVWPPADGTGVPRSWDPQWTTPMPKVPPEGWPSGPVISVVPGPGKPIKIEAHELKAVDSGELLPMTLQGVGSLVEAQLGPSAALYPNEPLASDTQYEVTLSGTHGGQIWAKSWRFRTRP